MTKLVRELGGRTNSDTALKVVTIPHLGGDGHTLAIVSALLSKERKSRGGIWADASVHQIGTDDQARAALRGTNRRGKRKGG